MIRDRALEVLNIKSLNCASQQVSVPYSLSMLPLVGRVEVVRCQPPLDAMLDNCYAPLLTTSFFGLVKRKLSSAIIRCVLY